MKILKFTGKFIFILLIIYFSGGCGEKIEVDPCLKTQWTQEKQVEFKIAVHMVDPQPLLPDGTPGSESPLQYKEMKVSGFIEMLKCYEDQSIEPISLGNTYLEKGITLPAPLEIRGIEPYWIGHVVFVFEFDNDTDHLNINLTVDISMENGQVYQCLVSKDIFFQQIYQVPEELYSYVLIDIYSDSWIKI